FCHLIICFPSGIVTRAAEDAVPLRLWDQKQRRMAARYHQCNSRIDDGRILEYDRVNVALDVVDPHKGLPGYERKRFGIAQPDKERAHQPRSPGYCKSIDSTEIELSQA